MPALTDPHLAAAMTGPHPRRRRSSPVPLSQRRAARVLRALLTPVLLAASTACVAQPPEPAAVGRDRPLTSTWLCENERSVLLNAHPRRQHEEAWLTYGGTRVAIARTRSASGVSFASGDGKVQWHEKGDEATLQFAGLLDAPLLCRRQDARRR
jgi:membrane-bound inhibitor of C-type lysozyme